MLNKIDRNSLTWSCRRGMLELDLLIMPWFLEQFDNLTAENQHIFANLLDETDLNLWKWLLKGEIPPENYSFLIKDIKAFKLLN